MVCIRLYFIFISYQGNENGCVVGAVECVE